MKLSAALSELLDSGAMNGWHYHERRSALRLIACESSTDLTDSVMREMKFLRDEEIFPAANVAGIRRSVARDPGPDGPPQFTHESTGDFSILKK